MHFSSSRLPVSTNYLTAIAFTFSATYQRPIFRANAVHRIRTCRSFTANDFQDRSLTTRTYGKYSSVMELPYSEIAFATTLYNFMRTFYRLRQWFVPCRKLAQCVGLEPTRRINARPFITAEFFSIQTHMRSFSYRLYNHECVIAY